MLRAAAIAAALLGVATTAHAQSNPALVFQQVPSATDWNNYFAGKVDVAAGALTNPTVTGGSINGTTLNSVLINSPTISGEVTGALTTSNTMTSDGGSSALVGTIVPTATTPDYVYGLTITKLAASVGQGSTSDAALHITTDFHETNGRSWHRGIVFGTAGTASYPVDVTGTLITIEASDSNLADIGVDMSGSFFVTASYKAMGFLVDPSGNVTGNSFTANSQAGVACAASTVTLATMVVTGGIVTHC